MNLLKVDMTKGERISPIANNQFKYRLGLKGFVGLGLVVVGLVTLPFPTGSFILIGLGSLLISPISFMVQIKNKYKYFKEYLGLRF